MADIVYIIIEQAMMLDKAIIVLVCFISMVTSADNLKNFRGGHFRVYKGNQENEVGLFILFLFLFIYFFYLSIYSQT